MARSDTISFRRASCRARCASVHIVPLSQTTIVTAGSDRDQPHRPTQTGSNGMQSWDNVRGLSTLNVVNAAINVIPGDEASICFGCGDNFGFSSADSGATWKTQDYLGGDNDCAFADPRQPSRMVVFAPRSVSTPPAADN